MMHATPDFERAWLTKFAGGLEQTAGKAISDQVMKGSEGLTSESSRQEVVAWTRKAMERLEALVDEGAAQEIMTGCACQYPRGDLRKIRQAYQATSDLDVAHQMLQDRFESFLRDVLELDGSLIEEIVHPVFVKVLKYSLPPHDRLALEVAQLTRAVATVCHRPARNVHILYQPQAAGLVSFGGKPIPAAQQESPDQSEP